MSPEQRARKYKEAPAPGAAQLPPLQQASTHLVEPQPSRVANSYMHHPHPSQGLPPPGHHPQHQQHAPHAQQHPQHAQHQPHPQSHQHHPRAVAVHHQQPHPDSPHQSQPAQSPAQAHYPSPHPANSQVPPQHQSPYVQQLPGPPGQHAPEGPYYPAHPSPYSNNSAPNSYSASEAPDLMAAAAMNNRPYNTIYNTPQSSNSPVPTQSPQTDQHGRQVHPGYGQPPAPMQQQQMYYHSPYAQSAQVPQQSPYAAHAPAQQPQPPMSNSLLISHPAQNHQMQHPQHQHQHQQAMGSPRARMTQTPLQAPMARPPSVPGGQPQAPPPGPPVGAPGLQHPGAQTGANVNPNAAPGPIPATTPLVVKQDQNGVQWIAFEYSRDRVKMEYTIRCDVESIAIEELSSEFKTENCVYPRACCPKDAYKGNRFHYETECNTVGWALAQLNPALRGKRGLIQRAVDSWRNSNQDPRLRSRRVRRQAKLVTRQKSTVSHGSNMGPGGQGPPGMPNSAGLSAPPRPPNMGMGGAQMHHPHDHQGGPPGGNEDVSENEYTHHHTARSVDGPPANEARPGQSFYPQYPTSDSVASSSGCMPPMHDPMGQHARLPPPPTGTKRALRADEEEEKKAIFGDLPEAKKRKFILVEDTQRNTRVRVRVTLDAVNMDELPDSFREMNSVFPRSFFSTGMTTEPVSPTGEGMFPDDAECPQDKPDCPLAGTQDIKIKTVDGDVTVPGPKLTRSKRIKEIRLNTLGHRMCWAQGRVFAGRPLFLQKSLDAYRSKQRMALSSANQDSQEEIPTHFDMRVGKRRWNQWNNKRTETRGGQGGTD